MQTTTERTYIKELKGGSRKAFTALYQMYSNRIYGFCFQWTKSHEDAEEVLQDVFTRLWVHRDTIQEEDTLLYFIFRVAKNLLINRYRSQLNSPVFEEYVQYNHEAVLQGDNAAQPLEFAEFRQLIDRISRTLPQTQQLVFEYSVHRQMSHQEIAQALGLSEQTIRNQLSLALKVFREKLRDRAGGWVWFTILLLLLE